MHDHTIDTETTAKHLVFCKQCCKQAAVWGHDVQAVFRVSKDNKDVCLYLKMLENTCRIFPFHGMMQPLKNMEPW